MADLTIAGARSLPSKNKTVIVRQQAFA